MLSYLLRRLFLLPLTLFAIILVNFVILNLAPGDPVTLADTNASGEASRRTDAASSGGDQRYLLFREHYGLTLPILFNTWPTISREQVHEAVTILATQKQTMLAADYHALLILWGDRAHYIMPLLVSEAENKNNPLNVRAMAANLFVRGGIKSGFIGASLTSQQKEVNKKIAKDNDLLGALRVSPQDSAETLNKKVGEMRQWLATSSYEYPLSFSKKLKTFFVETRFCRYVSRVITLDFGTLRNDANKSVIDEVVSRFKYSLTLAVIPMVITFILCQIFGMIMALQQNKWLDHTLNSCFLILFAVPIFVVAPFLIENIAIGHTFPLTHIPIPTSGFHSPEAHYLGLTSSKRLLDVSQHLILPMIAIIYGTLAIQSRISRTAILEVLRQDFVKTARAKGLKKRRILVHHVGKNAAITIVTSLATSLGVILGGSLIVETIFEINGFGRFFYEAIVNRDYNVMLFSVFAGSLLTLLGYLVADILYTILDPRVSLE